MQKNKDQEALFLFWYARQEDAYASLRLDLTLTRSVRTYGSHPVWCIMKIKQDPLGLLLFSWYARQDSNLRPFAPQANALSS